MPQIALVPTLMFLVSISLQIGMLFVIPSTRGYTNLVPTLVCLACINVAVWLISRLIAGGAQLSILVPISAALIPLGATVIGIFVYGEPASPLKIATLVAACGLIGAAGYMT